MRIIAIETSGRYGSVAALVGEIGGAPLIHQTVLSGEQRTAQSLAPILKSLLSDIGWAPQSIELVAVADGPGSFTGLRIGVTTAKTFAYAVGAGIVGVNTLDVLATQARVSSEPLWTIMEAQRQELFVAKFSASPEGKLFTECPTAIVATDEWLARLGQGDRVIGPALQRLASRLSAGVIAEPDNVWQPMATAVGQVAWQAYQSGRRDDVWKMVPNYYRASAAEEKAAKTT